MHRPITRWLAKNKRAEICSQSIKHTVKARQQQWLRNLFLFLEWALLGKRDLLPFLVGRVSSFRLLIYLKSWTLPIGQTMVLWDSSLLAPGGPSFFVIPLGWPLRCPPCSLSPRAPPPPSPSLSIPLAGSGSGAFSRKSSFHVFMLTCLCKRGDGAAGVSSG